MICINCSKILSGRQTKYCSKQCKNKILRDSKITYLAQKRRRYDRKYILLDYKGNKCERCGYDKNRACLHFHHLNTDEKDYNIANNTDRKSIQQLKTETDKCVLLCANCHFEEHYPQFSRKLYDL